jgi:hypothetical protein
MVVEWEGEHMLCNRGDENESGVEVVIWERYPGIRMDWKITGLLKDPCDKWC